MLNILIYLILNVFRIYIMSMMTASLCKGKQVKKDSKRIMICTVFYIVNSTMYLVFKNPYVNMSITLAGLFCIASLYTKKIYTILVSGIAVYILAAIAETLTLYLFTTFEIGKVVDHFYDIVIIVILWIFKMLIQMMHTKQKRNDVSKWLLVIVPVLSVLAVVVFFIVDTTMKVKIMVFFLYMTAVNLFVLYFYCTITELYTEKCEYQLLKQRVDIYAHQMDMLTQTQEVSAMIRHDFKHHMNELKIMAIKEDAKAIQDYLEQMNDYMYQTDLLISSGNKEIDSLLNYMLTRARNVLKQVNTTIQIPENLTHSFDVNIVLGNLLENAIEAAEKSEEKFLLLQIKYMQGLLYIDISNSYHVGLQKVHGNILTTKKNASIHGIGLKSVKKIVDKYHGRLEIREENHISVFVMMYI